MQTWMYIIYEQQINIIYEFKKFNMILWATYLINISIMPILIRDFNLKMNARGTIYLIHVISNRIYYGLKYARDFKILLD